MSEFHDVDRRVAILEQIAADTQRTLAELRAEIRGLRTEIGGVRGEIAGLRAEIDGKFDSLRAELNRQFRWLIGIWFTSLGAVLAVMAHGFHWL